MLHYILQVIAFQLVFLLIFDIFLKRETFFNVNRFYLLFTAVVSFLIPFVEFDMLKTVVPQDFVVRLPEVVIGNSGAAITPTSEFIGTANPMSDSNIPIWELLFWIGFLITLVVFGVKLGKLLWLHNKNPRQKKGNLFIIALAQSNAAFSFFNRIFIGDQIHENQLTTVISHETVHARQWHTLDLLLFEILRIVMWFNPLVYIYQNRIKALHEFIADAEAIKSDNKSAYYQGILHQIFESHTFSFTNSFYKQSLMKKRITMLQKQKSKHKALLKYILLLPVIIGMLVYVSCEKEGVPTPENSLELEQFSFSRHIDQTIGTSELKKKNENYNAFLWTNSDHVGWQEINHETGIVLYTIHHKDEKVPEEFTEGEVSNKEGKSYKVYMNFSYFDYGVSSTKTETEVEEVDLTTFNRKPEVPYAVIDQVPVFEGCNNLTTNEERKRCTSDEIGKFIIKNFNTNLATTLGLTGRQRISIFFKISTTGEVIEIGARAPHQELEEEAKRVVSLLPKFKPGLHNSETVTVPYALPILFQVED